VVEGGTEVGEHVQAAVEPGLEYHMHFYTQENHNLQKQLIHWSVVIKRQTAQRLASPIRCTQKSGFRDVLGSAYGTHFPSNTSVYTVSLVRMTT
jgi:hypothetical protein